MKRKVFLAALFGIFCCSSVFAGWSVINFHPSDSRVLKSELRWKSGDKYGGRIDFSTDQMNSYNTEHAALWYGSPDSWIDIHPAEYRSSALYDVCGNNPIGNVITFSGNSNPIVYSQDGNNHINIRVQNTINSSLVSCTENQIVGTVYDPNRGERALVWSRNDAFSNSWSIKYLDPPNSYKSLAHGTDGVRQVGVERYIDNNEKAGMWAGTPESWVYLHPAGAVRSGAVAIKGDTQVGRVRFPDSDDRAAVWHNNAESFIDMHPVGATFSEITKTTGYYHSGEAYFGGNLHAIVWTGDDPNSWFDLHSVLDIEFADGWSRTTNIYQSGREIWITGSAGTFDSNRKYVNTRAMLWHYTPDHIDAVIILENTVSEINAIDMVNFKNRNMRNALTNKINEVIGLIEQGAYDEASDKLEHDVLAKTNGCASSGYPDKNDWITDCPSQNQIYPLLIEAIGYLKNIE